MSKSRRWLAAGISCIVILCAGWFGLHFLQQHKAVTSGGFASVKEMELLHRLGYASRAEYINDRRRDRESALIEERAKEVSLENTRMARQKRLAKIADKEHRIRNLPRDIALSDMVAEGQAYVGAEDFKLACETAHEIEKRAIIWGAKEKLFRPFQVNDLVKYDPSSVGSIIIREPVRWNYSVGGCRAWFTIDGIYNGIRYRGYYYGMVSTFRKYEDGTIKVSGFDERFRFYNTLE